MKLNRRNLGLMCVWMILHGLAFSQADPLILLGSGKPAVKRGAEHWYLDTLNQIAWRREGRAWTQVSQDTVQEMLPCHGFLHIRSGGIGTIWDASGKVATEYHHCSCSDSLRIVWYSGITVFYEPDGATLHATHCGANWKAHDSIQGMACFCLPQREATGNQMLDCEEIRQWGMLGANGKWLIEPRFDGPFRFQNGFAAVLYYGQRRKINEKGEFVE